ncbi:MAG: NAD+ synthase, partial [Bacteroidia bacterium]|nr:NAD+ synthase [Bacteroidia bacterium]
YNYFTEQSEKAVQRIAQASSGIAVIVGSPGRNPKPEGKNLFNSAYFIADGEVKKIIHKSLLPTYDVFDEYRYFEPGKESEVIEYKGERFALTICEDLWNLEDDPLYTFCPVDNLIKDNPEFIINIAASPFAYDHFTIRKNTLAKNAVRYKLPVIYVNHVGSQTELIFDGGSLAMNSKGEVVNQMKFFEEDFFIVDTKKINSSSPVLLTLNEKPELIYDALILGIRDYFLKMNFSKATLGLSGGIDSALTMALAVHALGKQNVVPVLMPSKYSSLHSVSDAVQLCKNLDTHHELISIFSIYDEFIERLHPVFGNKPFDVTEENIQARIRSLLLMALCNKHGYILLNTSDKSELATGYGTLYGDMSGGLSVIGDLYKTDVYDLSRWINRNGEVIPQSIIDKPPSAELRPEQKTIDSLPDFSVLDKILYQYIEKFSHPNDIAKMGFDEATVLNVIRMVNNNEYKRKQLAPVLRVSPKAFGMGRRMPIVGKYIN